MDLSGIYLTNRFNETDDREKEKIMKNPQLKKLRLSLEDEDGKVTAFDSIDVSSDVRSIEIKMNVSFGKTGLVKKLDVQKKLFKIGQRFKLGSSKETYVLVSCGPSDVILVDPKSGSRWSEAASVREVHAITEEELASMLAGYPYRLVEE